MFATGTQKRPTISSIAIDCVNFGIHRNRSHVCTLFVFLFRERKTCAHVARMCKCFCQPKTKLKSNMRTSTTSTNVKLKTCALHFTCNCALPVCLEKMQWQLFRRFIHFEYNLNAPASHIYVAYIAYNSINFHINIFWQKMWFDEIEMHSVSPAFSIIRSTNFDQPEIISNQTKLNSSFGFELEKQQNENKREKVFVDEPIEQFYSQFWNQFELSTESKSK